MAHGKNDIWTAESHSKALLKVATPELYRQNAFRVLGLPVNATLREIERHRKKLEMMAKLDIESSGRNHGYLPLDPPPDRDSIRQAIEHLRDPEKRLIDQFFWFWPLKAGSSEDKAFELLSEQNIDEALNVWKENEQEGCYVSTHNIAIFYHLTALDIENASAGETLSVDELDRCQAYWKNALRQWQKLLEAVEFWKLLTDHIRDLNDPRLTSETARSIYGSLPKVLLLIHAKLVVRATEAGDNKTVERHMQLMKEYGFEERLLQDVLHDAASPIRERIKLLCAPVTHKAKENPQQANQLLRSLLEKTMPWLQAIDILLPNSSVVRETLHDEVAETVRSCTVIYGNETANWKECLWLTEQVLTLPVSTSLRTRLDNDAKYIKENLEQEQEYEELKQKVSSNQVFEVSVFRETVRVPPVCTCCLGEAQTEQQVSYSWEERRGLSKYERTRAFNFPLCWICKHHQLELRRKRLILVLSVVALSVIVSYIIGVNLERTEYWPFLLMGSIVSVVVFAISNRLLRLRSLGQDHASRGPAVSMKRAGEYETTFRFWNPVYAHLFAQANNYEMVPCKVVQYSHKSSLIRGRSAFQVIGWVAALAFIGHSIIYGVLGDQWDYSSTYSSPRYRHPKRTTTNYTGSSLLSQITDGKARLRKMDAQLEQMGSQLESLSSQINTLKGTIEGYEAQAATGQYVSSFAYNQALNNHNELVNKHNRLLNVLRDGYSEYEKELKRVNEMIDQYNRTRY